MPLKSNNSPHNSAANRLAGENLRLGAFIRAARWLTEPDNDDLLMPLWATDESTADTRPEALGRARRRLENRLANDSDKNLRWIDCQQSVAECDAEQGFCAISHFEKVTGHSLASLETLRQESASPANKNERPARQSSRRTTHRMKMAGSQVLAPMLLAYVMLLAVSHPDPNLPASIFDPQVQSIAWLDLGETARGTEGVWDIQMKTKYQSALGMYRNSRTSVLGAFPGFDRGELARAADLLEAAILFQGQHEVASSRAILLLAQAKWNLGDNSESADLLRVVLNRNDEESETAKLLLRNHGLR